MSHPVYRKSNPTIHPRISLCKMILYSFRTLHFKYHVTTLKILQNKGPLIN